MVCNGFTFWTRFIPGITIEIERHIDILAAITFPDIVINGSEIFLHLLLLQQILILRFFIQFVHGALTLLTLSWMVPVNTLSGQMIKEVWKEWQGKQ